MKAVMMNSADKLVGVHGSTRDVLNADGNDWNLSPANMDPSLPLDPTMGTGHLNAKKSVQQLSTGECNPGSVPLSGWDYEGVGDRNEYVFNAQVSGYIAATLTWDRRVEKTSSGNYMDGDQFTTQTPQQRLNNLDLYLMPVNSNNFADAIAASIAEEQNVEHIFFDVATAGQYKLVVHNNPVGGIGDFQNYALAWWIGNGPASPLGDYNKNGSVGPEDYDVWKSNFGSSFADADGNGNGTVDAADYTVWRDNLGAGSGSAGASPSLVPEPAAVWLMLAAVLGVSCSRQRVGIVEL